MKTYRDGLLQGMHARCFLTDPPPAGLEVTGFIFDEDKSALYQSDAMLPCDDKGRAEKGGAWLYADAPKNPPTHWQYQVLHPDIHLKKEWLPKEPEAEYDPEILNHPMVIAFLKTFSRFYFLETIHVINHFSISLQTGNGEVIADSIAPIHFGEIKNVKFTIIPNKEESPNDAAAIDPD
jgi:hypothetical protein